MSNLEAACAALRTYEAARPAFRTWLEPSEVEALEARNAARVATDFARSEELGAEILAAMLASA